MSQQKKILLVDDHRPLLFLLSMRLSSAGYEIITAASGEEAVEKLSEVRPHLVVTDLRMGGMDGMALFDYVQERYPTLPVIILTAHGTIPQAVQATKRGVFSFLTKPFDSDELLGQVNEALLASGETGGDSDRGLGDWSETIVTKSLPLIELLSQAKIAAKSDGAVLLRGESGTGRELLARAIHAASARRDEAFVVLDCAALPEQPEGEEDAESIRAAEGGTLFLRGVGDLSPSYQARLLGLLEGAFREDKRGEAADVRLISSTTRDVEREVTAGNFREELYYKLRVVEFTLPRLSDRREDIPLLSGHFLRRFAEGAEKSVQGFSAPAMALLMDQPWPGNVRQLRNAVEQAVTVSTAPIVSDTLLKKAMREEEIEIQPFSDAKREFERDYFVRVLKATRGNVSRAAGLAERNRTEFYKLLQRHKLVPSDFRG